ncbi:hypothetical protein [Brevibacterium sp. HMSC22B09]|nr:hypothetical protein [Brevibacterium sp. HMSC22B09]
MEFYAALEDLRKAIEAGKASGTSGNDNEEPTGGTAAADPAV